MVPRSRALFFGTRRQPASALMCCCPREGEGQRLRHCLCPEVPLSAAGGGPGGPGGIMQWFGQVKSRTKEMACRWHQTAVAPSLWFCLHHPSTKEMACRWHQTAASIMLPFTAETPPVALSFHCVTKTPPFALRILTKTPPFALSFHWLRL